MLEKIKKIFICFCVLFTVFVMVIIFTPIANIMAGFLEIEPKYEKADVIVVLAGGIYPDGTLSSFSKERMLQAVALYRMGYAPKMMIIGSSILNGSKKLADAFTESTDDFKVDVVDSIAMKNAAIKLGVKKEDILIDTATTHTFENIKKAISMMKENNFKTALLVTSDTHMYRAIHVGIGIYRLRGWI
ncbi:MAG: YdcF family protein [Deltaproteobacteria bacterium]|nr:YdcF family protein [Deltaproteobacteria bacterium]